MGTLVGSISYVVNVVRNFSLSSNLMPRSVIEEVLSYDMVRDEECGTVVR